MIDTAVLLAAGEGSRLRSAAASKPLCPVGGKPLIEHAIHGFAAAGLTRVVVVLGYEADRIEAHLAAGSWPIAVETVRTADHRQPNGVSVLAAERALAGGEAVLAMCDHLVDPALYARVARAGAGGGARLAIDRRVDSDLVDLDDVTAVRTQGEAIVAIGKHLPDYDCFDTGVFAIGPGLFAALNSLPAPSLTEGMRVLAAQGIALTIDCSDLGWIDVDDPAALDKAEEWLRAA
ncbi:MAG: NTP transferase domain-containing protein [Sphingomonas sp.]|uniref:phosphocholine cytidylyltransferase family protein n=1 Tax=Sphingomonas sp. TaxID=28214 RepID=UPI0022766B50|nr:NTP transferase domain-containing protein [Sphingomonas sp.]MCX8477510.1 NTP transferase domain-containing protein [Sphingomonas sp.]